MNKPDTTQITETHGKTLLWGGVTLAVAVVTRLALWLTYSPVAYSDTPSYRRLAESVLNGFARYDGTRTPGYPAFYALLRSDSNVWLAQMVLGVLVAMMLFYLGRRLSGRSWFGALMAIAHSLNLGQLFFEADLLTETLTTFCLSAAFAGVYLLLRQVNHAGWGLAVGVGLATSLALLTRPLFIYLPVWAGLFIALSPPACPSPAQKTGKGIADNQMPEGDLSAAEKNRTLPWKACAARVAAFSLPVVLLVGGWVLFIHQRFGDWGLTTMTGYHLIQHTGSYFEYVPDEYAGLRDTYLHYRDAKIAATGTQTNTIWEAIPEMSQVSGLDFYELSRTLAKISIRLIREHPDLYLRNVAQGWWMFWHAPVYWSPDALQTPALAGLLSGLIAIQRGLLAGANLLFVAGSLLWAAACWLPARWIERLPRFFQTLRSAFRPVSVVSRSARVNQHFMLFLASNIWITSILQSLLDHGDNPRFLIPLQSFVLLWLAWFLFTAWLNRSPGKA